MKRIKPCGDTCKENGKDAVRKKELSCSNSVKAFSPAKKTRCSHAETMYDSYRDDTETKHASPEADWPTLTDVNNRCRTTKDSDIPGDKKTKPE